MKIAFVRTYSDEFYECIQRGARRSAEVIVPILLEFLQPTSVVDVGCGTGAWLAVLLQHGVQDVLGIDGDDVEEKFLEISKSNIQIRDLRFPIAIEKRFDLAISLEVGEHLPPESADTFVDSLTQLAPAVLFSAAIPFQGGANHVNEQWLDYWSNRFHHREFVAVDCIRRRVWDNSSVEYWYAQNMVLFVHKDRLADDRYSRLRNELERTDSTVLSLVHPRKYLEAVERYLAEQKAARWYASEAQKYSNLTNRSLGEVIRVLPGLTKRALTRRFFAAHRQQHHGDGSTNENRTRR